MHGRIRFLVDENLARLTRWLRFFGFDALLAQGWTDRQVAARAEVEARVLVTRDSDLTRGHSAELIWLRSDDLRDQLIGVLSRVGVPPVERWFSLCVECGWELRQLDPGETAVHPLVPETIKSNAGKTCWLCQCCGRVYWQGSHYQRMFGFLAEVAQASQDPRVPKRVSEVQPR